MSLVNSIYRPNSRESYFDQCFEVLERLGEGSFGEVFKVRSKEDGRLYAVKKSLKLYRSQVSRQERIEEVKRYEQFSDHENCITLHKAWEQNDLLYMQLELCKTNLETYVMNRSDFLSEPEIWDILIDLLLAVKALHDHNLIHLDIKSENIMVSEDNVCKLGDFGLVTDLQKVSISSSKSRNFSSTCLIYMNSDYRWISTMPRKVIADTLRRKFYKINLRRRPIFLALVLPYLNWLVNWNYHRMVIYGMFFEAVYYQKTICRVSY